MKIIAIDFEPSTLRGGQEKSYFDLLTSLSTKGHKVILLYVKEEDFLSKYKAKGVQTIQIPTVNLVNKRSIKEWWAFMRAISVRADIAGAVIYINQIMDLPLAYALKKFRGANKIVCHLRLPPLGYNLKRANNQLALALPAVTSFIVANNNMKEAHAESGIPIDKIVVIPNAFDFSKFPIPTFKKTSIDKLHIAFAGRFEKEKGLLELIEELTFAHENGVNLSLSIGGSPYNVGHQEYKKTCQSLITSSGISERIQWVGHVDNPIAFFGKHHLTIMPSTWNEPFGRVLVESLIAGTPVVARDVGAVREIINDPSGKWVYKNKEDLLMILKNFRFNVDELKEKIEYIKVEYDSNRISVLIENVLGGNSARIENIEIS